MKKTLLFLGLALLCISTCFAKIHKIQVSNFQFTPSALTARVGDTIMWVWKNGTHTTTSLTIPMGAAPWNSNMNSTTKRFSYVVTVVGTYNFDCTIHPTLMTGTITVKRKTTAALGDLDISTENAKAVLTWKVDAGDQLASSSVQRSTDGRNFTEIANLRSTSANQYTYTDQTQLSNKYVYYQVLVTDKQGNSELSDIKMYENKQANAPLITSISPNPVSSGGHIMLQFNADGDGQMHVQLFTQGGKLVTETDMTAVKGLNNGHLHVDALQPGSYYLVCTLGDKTEKHTVLCQ
jgi:plastocyanin